MSSQWRNEYAIMRDLSVAQRGCVTVKIERTVGEADKPPALHIENTDEEFMKHCSGDAKIVKPDLGLIKSMLDLIDCKPDDDANLKKSRKSIEISKARTTEKDYIGNAKRENKVQNLKLNPNVPEFLPLSMVTIPNMPDVMPDCSDGLKKQGKIVAINSLLHMEQTHVNKTYEVNRLVITKPSDFHKKTATSYKNANDENVEYGNVYSYLNTGRSAETPKTETPKRLTIKDLLLVKPSQMFQRKSGSPTKSPEAKGAPKPTSVIEEFKPSKWAETYAKTYEERAKINEERGKITKVLKDDIWARVEKEMKESDKKRQLELEKRKADRLQKLEAESRASASTSTHSADKTFPDLFLPEHRHLLTGSGPGECVVCETMKKYQKREP